MQGRPEQAAMGLAAEVQEPDATAKDDGGRRRDSGRRDLAQEDGRGARSGDGEAWSRKAGRGVEAEATGGAGAEQERRRGRKVGRAARPVLEGADGHGGWPREKTRPSAPARASGREGVAAAVRFLQREGA